MTKYSERWCNIYHLKEVEGKMTIKEINIFANPDAGCGNGKYHECEIVMDDTTIFRVPTCACMRGCSGTANVDALKVGDVFNSEDDLLDIIYPIIEED